MRLINTATLQQKDFLGSSVEPYAILSHTWTDEEVDFQRFQRDTATHDLRVQVWASYHDPKNSELSAGWKKVLDCCRLAQKQGLQWVWCDTCCIDKTSSAELSEAINSMYRWYKRAKVCFAFLSDFDLNDKASDELSDCRWFYRGWALQELLAPPEVELYDRKIQFIGTRSDLAYDIAVITRIEASYLRVERSLSAACSAEKMFWAARRETTRVEDQAYCLLGLFDVNMPLLYGEGEKAFTRLQQQIIAQSSDESIFAWTLVGDNRPGNDTPGRARGMLAHSTNEFASSGNVRKTSTSLVRAPTVITNQGLEFSVAWYSSRMVVDPLTPSPARRLRIPLACEIATGPQAGQSIAITLSRGSQSLWRWNAAVWNRQATSSHRTTGHAVVFFQQLEAIGAGYTKTNISLQGLGEDPEVSNALPRRCARIRDGAVSVSLLLMGVGVVEISTGYLQRVEPSLGAPTAVIFQWMVLTWYLTLFRWSFWSVALLAVPVARKGLQHLLALIACLLALSLVRPGRRYIPTQLH